MQTSSPLTAPYARTTNILLIIICLQMGCMMLTICAFSTSVIAVWVTSESGGNKSLSAKIPPIMPTLTSPGFESITPFPHPFDTPKFSATPTLYPIITSTPAPTYAPNASRSTPRSDKRPQLTATPVPFLINYAVGAITLDSDRPVRFLLETESENFQVSAWFTNPQEQDLSARWDAGFIVRQSSDGEKLYAVLISNQGIVSLLQIQNKDSTSTEMASVHVRPYYSQAKNENFLSIRAWSNTLEVSVNGKMMAAWRVDDIRETSKIVLVAGVAERSPSIRGAELKFSQFRVVALPE